VIFPDFQAVLAHWRIAVLPMLLALLMAGCAETGFVQSLQRQPHTPDPDFSVKYLGTGCLLMEYKGSKLLTDPFVSNPRMMRTVAGTIGTDTAYVNRHLRPEELTGVRMVASGHSHYDHLLDLPYLCSSIPNDATLCVNRTGKHILAPYHLKQPQAALDSLAGDSLRVGQWVYATDSSIRVMAFASLHPPQFMGIHLMRGHLNEDLAEPPTHMKSWLQGRTHTFLADFMEHGKPAHRIYFSSSMAPAPFGLFPKELLDEKSVDAIFIGAAGDRDPMLYPIPVIELTRPKRVYLIHWESFFRSKDIKAKAIGRHKLLKIRDEVVASLGDTVPVTITYPLYTY
jgi:hypothetical protein